MDFRTFVSRNLVPLLFMVTTLIACIVIGVLGVGQGRTYRELRQARQDLGRAAARVADLERSLGEIATLAARGAEQIDTAVNEAGKLASNTARAIVLVRAGKDIVEILRGIAEKIPE
jgi:hypothetical protein